MATGISAASGDFTASATWVGGIVPGVGDDALASNGHTIVIDADVTVGKVFQEGTGKFTLGDGRTLTANVEASTGTFASGGTVDVVATTTAAIVGDVSGLSSTAANIAGVVVSGSGTLTITGNVTGTTGNSVTPYSAMVYTNATGCTIVVNGDVAGGSGQRKVGIVAGPSSDVAITINGDVTAVNTSSHGVDALGASVVTVNGNVIAGTGTAAFGVRTNKTSDVIVINGNLIARNGTNSVAVFTSAESIVVVGDVNGGTGSSGNNHGLHSTGASAVVNITGNVTAGTGGAQQSTGARIEGASAVVTITGNVTGSPGTTVGSSRFGLDAPGLSANVTITGNVTGIAGDGVRVGGQFANVTVTGDILGSVLPNIFGIYALGASSFVTFVGSVTAAGASGHGINSAATNNGVIGTGDLTDSGQGAVAVYSRIFRMSDTNEGVTTYTNTVGFPTGTPVSRVSPNKIVGMAEEVDVRQGITYGFNDELVGSLAVPPATAVASGVPVDSTVGTAALLLSDVAAVTGAQIAAAITSPPLD